MAAFSSSFQQQQQQPFILDSPPFLPINIHPSPSPSPSPSSVVSVTNNNIIMDSSSTPALTHKRKSQEEKKGKKHCKKMKKNEENINKDSAAGYVHVRARRGQATDSHSLAERVRREKISERMKLLQSLVPGCARVTGKAPMLDEIINYIQSLQYQTEFLSMSLASLSPTYYDFGTDLESLMVSPDHHHQMQQDSGNLPSPTTAIDKYPRRLLDDSDHDSLLLQQPQMSSDVFFPLI